MVYLHTAPMGVHRACFFIARAGRAATPERNRSGNQPPILCILPLVAHQLASARKILLRAIVRHGPKTGDLPSVWLDTCGSLPYQPDALARVAASPSQGFAGSKASRGQRLRGVKPCSGLRKAGRRPRTGFAGPFKGAGSLFGHRDLESRSPGRRSSGRAVSSLFEALGHADVLSRFTRPGQGTIDATNQMVDAIGMIQAEDRGYYPGKKVSHPCTY